MGKAADERLQRYFDGEMPAEERAQVEAALTEDDKLKLAALGRLTGKPWIKVQLPPASQVATAPSGLGSLGGLS